MLKRFMNNICFIYIFPGIYIFNIVEIIFPYFIYFIYVVTFFLLINQCYYVFLKNLQTLFKTSHSNKKYISVIEMSGNIIRVHLRCVTPSQIQIYLCIYKYKILNYSKNNNNVFILF